MDKNCHSSSDSTTTNSSSSSSSNRNNHKDQYIRHLNKISRKISKPTFDHNHNHNHHHHHHHRPPPHLQTQSQPQNQHHPHQPPVYNINKSDFRDVVQKLTGSPVHERFSTPPPVQPPKPQSSRLQRIRPPPLAQISNRPPPLLNCAAPPPGQRPVHPPLSPLPPFPAVHAAAESPVSAYMRYLQSSTPTPDFPQFQAAQHNQLQRIPQPANSATQPQFVPPTPPMSTGCLPSPNRMFPQTTVGQLGFQQLPVSPRLSVPSPRWKDIK